jgi:HD-GYP domain-containing protein (c-di-GMP phosphodiesterase class II)
MREERDLKLYSGGLRRMFLTLFVGFTLVPFGLLFYLYVSYGAGPHRITVSRDNLGVLILLVGVLCLLGFFAMNNILVRIVRLSESVRQALMGQVDREMIHELVKGEGEVGELARSFGQIVTQLEDNVRQLQSAKQTLQEVMSKVARALASMETVDSLLNLVLETANRALGTQNGAVFVVGDDGQPVTKVWKTAKPADESEIRKAYGAAVAMVQQQRQTFVMPAVAGDSVGQGLAAPPLVCVPLSYRGSFLGALCLAGGNRRGGFGEEDLSLVQNLGSQIAVSFENARLNRSSEHVYFETMAALALAVEARDSYSHGHSQQVGYWADRIGQDMGLPEQDLKTLRDAARLHDIGKIGITDSILRKAESLDNDEMVIMRDHPIIGENIVAPLRTFRHLLDPIRHHHEKLDGSGYPDGLKGDRIPLITRIMAVADIYDAFRGDRPYRKALTVDQAMAELNRLAAQGKVDADVVAHLDRVVRRELA